MLDVTTVFTGSGAAFFRHKDEATRRYSIAAVPGAGGGTITDNACAAVAADGRKDVKHTPRKATHRVTDL